jgi:hypothetical protein
MIGEGYGRIRSLADRAGCSPIAVADSLSADTAPGTLPRAPRVRWGRLTATHALSLATDRLPAMAVHPRQRRRGRASSFGELAYPSTAARMGPQRGATRDPYIFVAGS